MSTALAPTTATAKPAAPARAWIDWCFIAAWLIAGLATAGWVFTLRPIWASKPDLADRFLIPMASGWLIYRAWPRLRAIAPVPMLAGLLPLAIGCAMFALGWYVAVQVSGRPIVVWWLTAALLLLIAGLALVHLGWPHAKLLLFPLLFILFSLPTPGRVYNPLMLRLKQFTTTTAQHVLPWLGVPVERPDPTGFELRLSSGDLGVVEACSGVRSVTALTAIAVLVAYLRGFALWRGLVLVGLTVGVIAVTNAIRVIVTGLLQENLGRAAIEGKAHDGLGVAVVLVGFALIVGISSLIAPRVKSGMTMPAFSGGLRQRSIGANFRVALCLAMMLPALGACIWAEQFRIDHTVVVPLADLPERAGNWLSETVDVPEVIKDELMCDQVVRRIYRNADGQEIQAYIMFWASAASTGHQHHPDICYPFRGWEVSASHMKPLDLPSGGQLPVSVRHYVKPDHQQILFFWTQHGPHVLADGIEKPELMSGHSWILELLKNGHQPIDSGARISVLIGTTTRGTIEPGERLLRDFTRDFADGLYQLCPWARPREQIEPRTK